MGNTNEATENVNVNEEYTTKKLRRVLGKKELISMGLRPDHRLRRILADWRSDRLYRTIRRICVPVRRAVLSGGYHPQHFLQEARYA